MAGTGEGPAIGIDLGTTYSCVAVWHQGKVDVIVNGQGNRTTPSYVAFAGSDRLVGEAAFNQSARNPLNTIFDAKRLIGRTFSDPMVQSDIRRWPFKVIDGGGDRLMISVSFEQEERIFSAEDISSMVLQSMKEMAENQLGTSIRNAVITVPAYFNNAQREATKDAGVAAGLNVLRVINEPTAAAMAYGLARKKQPGGGKRTILVFDLGGGTFDVSLLTIDGNELKVISTAGDSHLGGIDFDQRLVEFCCEEMERKHGVDVRDDPRALRRLRTKCEAAKKVLSFMVETTIEAEYLHGEVDFQCTVTAARFEELNMDLFTRCVELTEACLKDSNVDKEAVDDVVLVGGSTRIPKIQELIKELFHGKTKISRELNPDEAVAVGAAIHAAMLGGDDTQFVDDLFLSDVTPLSLGINSAGGLMSVLIPRNTPIPIKANRLFSTSFDHQTCIKIRVYEGERALTTCNNFLGWFELSDIPEARTGVPRILVCFEIDEDGLLTVSAENKQTKERKQITITRYEIARRNRQEIWRMVVDGHRNEIEDAEIRRKLTPLPNNGEEVSNVEILQEQRVGGEASREASEVEIQQDEVLREASKVEIPRDEVVREASMEEHQGSRRRKGFLGFLCLKPN